MVERDKLPSKIKKWAPSAVAAMSLAFLAATCERTPVSDEPQGGVSESASQVYPLSKTPVAINAEDIAGKSYEELPVGIKLDQSKYYYLGEKVPSDLTFKTRDGNSVSLENWEGRPLLLYYCCQADLPELDQKLLELERKGVDVVAVALEGSHARNINGIEPLLIDDGTFGERNFKRLPVYGTPSLLMLNSDHVLADFRKGTDEFVGLEDAVDNLLSGKVNTSEYEAVKPISNKPVYSADNLPTGNE